MYITTEKDIMKVDTKSIYVKTKGEGYMINLTEEVQTIIQDSGIKEGLATIFVSGSTAAVTTIEFEPGLRKDFPDMLSRIAPSDIQYEHQKMWHDGNGHSHVRASLIGPSLVVPFVNSSLTLGTWQQIVVAEMDVRNTRDRKITVQIMGE